jgi:plasmid stabilization system protein ParE
VSREAEADIAEQRDYLRKERGDEAAREFTGAVYAAFQRLAAFPLAGPLRPDLMEDVRAYLVRSHIALYRDEGTHIRILRVLHQRRDLKKALAEAPPDPSASA